MIGINLLLYNQQVYSCSSFILLFFSHKIKLLLLFYILLLFPHDVSMVQIRRLQEILFLHQLGAVFDFHWFLRQPVAVLNCLNQIIYIFLTIFLYLLKCPQSLILSALRAFCFCGKPHISRFIFLYFRYQAWLKSR